MKNQQVVTRPGEVRNQMHEFLNQEFWMGEFAGKELMAELREAVERTRLLLEDMKKGLMP